MEDEATQLGRALAGATIAPGLPAAVHRARFEADLDGLRAREKAHTREATRSPRPDADSPRSR
jgi:hypothetical protein